MSGTSLDGVDAVLARFPAGGGIELVAHRHTALDATLRSELFALNSAGENELHRAALASNALARRYADAVARLLAQAGVDAGAVRAIGAHGQTVRHRPREFDGTGYTLQLLNAALLAELGRIDVVADLRSRDVAAGGQGAPLVPAFHRAIFARPDKSIAVLNLGGIANLTVLDSDGTTIGFDCGPANALMDHWCEQHLGHRFDAAGKWAACGAVDAALLEVMLGDAYFALAPPKSTGRDHFNSQWIARALSAAPCSDPQAVQATLAELTARVCATDVRRHASGAVELLVCGGGAFNEHLMRRLTALLPGLAVCRTDERGLPAAQVEAAAFAWLACAHCHRRTASIPAVTGAAGPRVLGALYPA